MDLKMFRKEAKYDKEEEFGGVPISPSSQSLSTSILSLSIQIILEFQQPVEEIDRIKKIVADALLPKSPRFSSILEEDEKGVLRWMKTTVNVDNHFVVAQFPPGHEFYDDLVNDYISDLCIKPFNLSRPLWEFHLLNYKTSKAQATLIMKVHHAVGDGISLMSALTSCATRADNPTLPPTFPASKNLNANGFKGSDKWSIFNYFGKLWYVVLVFWYTMVDVTDYLLRMMGWKEDSKLPIRGPPGVEYLPVAVSSTELPMVDMKQIKTCIGGTVNDVLIGIISCGIQHYLQICLSADGEKSLEDAYEKRCTADDTIITKMKNLRVTTLAMINTRILSRPENVEETMNKNTEVPWGNHFGFLHLPIPLKRVEKPLDFARRAKHIMDRYKMSLGIISIARILGSLGRRKGAQALAKCAYNTIVSTTMAISNMVGPIDKIAIAGNIVKRFSFFVSGAPQTLAVHILSYTDTITMQVIAHKDYINADILSKLFREAFEEMKKASIQNA